MNFQYSNPEYLYETKYTTTTTPTNQECSSGCESGWTNYLDHSSICNDSRTRRSSSKSRRFVKGESYQESEDEDLSMVSDASSGPPHFHEEQGYYGNDGVYHSNAVEAASLSSSRNRRKTKENRRSKAKEHQSSLLDDTASSPLFDHSNKNFNISRSQPTKEDVMVEYSQGYSTTQFEARPPYHEHYDFYQSGNQLQQNQWF